MDGIKLHVEPGAEPVIRQRHAAQQTRHYLCSPRGRQRIIFETTSDGRRMVITNKEAVCAFIERDFTCSSAVVQASSTGLWLHVHLDDDHYGSPYIQVTSDPD